MGTSINPPTLNESESENFETMIQIRQLMSQATLRLKTSLTVLETQLDQQPAYD